MNSSLEASRSLFRLRWKNSPDVYLQPDTHYRGPHVPSLVWFCLQCISEFPEQIQLPCKLIYRPPEPPSPKGFRFVDNLFRAVSTRRGEPSHLDKDSEPDLQTLDPRLWVTIIQIFDQIPDELRSYTLALNDELLPLMQNVKNTDTFALITILELPGCPALTDDSITELRCLHTLAAFDASNTSLSSHGIVTLARTLLINDRDDSLRTLRGPWGLRILRLKHCAGVDNLVYRAFSSFPLLAVVDLRGTKCRPPATPSKSSFSPSRERGLFSSDLASSLKALQRLQRNVLMFSAPTEYCFTLRIKKLCHERIASALTKLEAQPTKFLSRQSSVSSPESPYDNDSDYDRHYSGDKKWHDYSWDEIDEEASSDVTHGEEEEDPWRGYASLDILPSRDHDSDQPFISDSFPRPSGMSQYGEHTPSSSSPSLDHSDDERVHRHQTTMGLHSEETRSVKRLKTSTVSADETDGDDLELTLLEGAIGLPMTLHHRRGLHWYDADVERATAYVPLSLAKGDYDDKLMLYRPMQPWHILEQELSRLVEREAQSEKARIDRANGVPVMNAPGNKNMIRAREGLQSMTALALQRRQEANPQSTKPQAGIISQNPFARRKTDSQMSQSTTSTRRYAKALSSEDQKPLKPISMLRVPTLTQDILTKSKEMEGEDIFQKSTATASSSRKSEDSVSGGARQKKARQNTLAFAPTEAATPQTTVRNAGGSTRRRSTGNSHSASLGITDSNASNSVTSSSRLRKKSSTGKGKKTEETKFDWKGCFVHLMRVPTRYVTELQRELARKASVNIVANARPKTSTDRRLSTVTSPPRPYAFHIGASWAGKLQRDLDPRFKIPFPKEGPIGSWRDETLSRSKGVKSLDAGEDFLFVQEMRNGSVCAFQMNSLFHRLILNFVLPAAVEGVAFGVADGVGGWVESGVDPSLFSQALMYHAHRYSRNAWAGEPEIDPTLDYEEREQIEGWEMTPYECLDLAFHGVLREKLVQAGSSTACIISLNAANGILRAAKQLTKLPTNAGRRFSRACVDSPRDADTFQTKLRDGDIVVAYTDGFSDNVFPSEMATICRLVARSGGSEDQIAQSMADRMVEYSQQCMRSKTRVSPFERDAARQGMFFRGGKEDDVTVVVGLVRETS
ncbi:hypothetical protein NP233_g3464 [Leucocoprinus birnbaumii]|uniref:PPM-type phosphatase domain-containing protein n=1 Tax=Leucocoprinus birnbaumii TaxID=56174 RepID=A0AAD5VZ50_9AGAR|nr:hypothetical protein NP233_g3464 [Leucocoprinus birnbaumii]